MGGGKRKNPLKHFVKEPFDYKDIDFQTLRDPDPDEWKANLGSHYVRGYEALSPPTIMKLQANNVQYGLEVVDKVAPTRPSLARLKSAIFFTVMREDKLIAYLEPKRTVSRVGLFNQEKVTWSIKDSALKAVLNFGSKSRKLHVDKKPTNTMKWVYELLEAKYQRDETFRDDVNKGWGGSSLVHDDVSSDSESEDDPSNGPRASHKSTR